MRPRSGASPSTSGVLAANCANQCRVAFGVNQCHRRSVPIETHRQQAERAEQWLHKVYTEIEDRFLRQGDDRRDTPQRSQRTNRH
jgi:hypothetical protein